MKTYEVIKEVFQPCSGRQLPDGCEITEMRLEDPAQYVQQQYMQERSVEYLSTSKNGSEVIEALLEGGRKHRYTFSEVR